MAFIGVLLFAIAMYAVVFGFIFVFVPSFIIALINLIVGIVKKWPKHNIILLVVFGSIAIVCAIFGCGILLFYFMVTI